MGDAIHCLRHRRSKILNRCPGRQHKAPVACRLSDEVSGDRCTKHVFLFCCCDIWDLAGTGEDVPPRASQFLSHKQLGCILHRQSNHVGACQLYYTFSCLSHAGLCPPTLTAPWSGTRYLGTVISGSLVKMCMLADPKHLGLASLTQEMTKARSVPALCSVSRQHLCATSPTWPCVTVHPSSSELRATKSPK